MRKINSIRNALHFTHRCKKYDFTYCDRYVKLLLYTLCMGVEKNIYGELLLKDKLRGARFATPKDAVINYKNLASQLTQEEWNLFGNWCYRMRKCIEFKVFRNLRCYPRIITPWNMRYAINDVKVLRRAELSTNYRLLIADIKFTKPKREKIKT